MATAKTVPTARSVAAFLARAGDAQRRRDCEVLVHLMSEATGAPPVLWGESLLGFGEYHYVYESGREGDSPLVAFSPRKSDLSIHILPSLDGYESLLAKLGKHKAARSCLYVRRLEDIDLKVLRQVVVRAVKALAPQRVPG